MQQGDVKLFQTNDNGDIIITDGIVEMSGGLETSAYLSLFGGNEDDNGLDGSKFNWWANINETNTSHQYRSETQNLLQALSANTGNLRKIEDACNRDLAWFIDENIASSIVVVVSIPGINRVKIEININAQGEESSFEFVENWKVNI
jgi:phage gp46-like protein